MNLKDLSDYIEQVKQYNPKWETLNVVIPNNKTGMLGGTPCTSIEKCYRGIDHDGNKFFLHPSKPMKEI